MNANRQNEHLKQTIKQLRDDHARQDQSAIDADADLLATLAAAFQSRSAKNATHREQSVANLTRNLEKRSKERYEGGMKRVARSEELVESNRVSEQRIARSREEMDAVVAERGAVRSTLCLFLVRFLPCG